VKMVQQSEKLNERTTDKIYMDKRFVKNLRYFCRTKISFLYFLVANRLPYNDRLLPLKTGGSKII
jgi:hypothetical protein